MNIQDIASVILCGASGNRLCLLSRKRFPKQFLSLIDGKSWLQLTLACVGHIMSSQAMANTAYVIAKHSVAGAGNLRKPL